MKDEKLLVIKRPAMAEKIIEDVVKLPEDKEPTMWDIAQTFPAYDWSINAFHRDGLTEEEKKNIFLKWYGKHWAYTSQIQSVMESIEAKLKERNT